jgi:hypothetical protein
LEGLFIARVDRGEKEFDLLYTLIMNKNCNDTTPPPSPS